MRYFVWFGYDGTRYHGWQVQPNGITVQEELERALSLLLREEIQVTGAGRTDTGVHARQMAAHFDTDAPIDDCTRLAARLNGVLPCDIGVDRVEAVPDDKHARFSATARTYRYYIHYGKNPFARQYALQTHYKLDFERMNKAGRILLEHDALPRDARGVAHERCRGVVFRDHRQPLPPQHGARRGGHTDRGGSG